MTLGVHPGRQSQEPRCPRILPCPFAVPSTSGDDAGPPEAEGLAARVAAGPGLWEDEDWLADLRRESLPGSLLAGGTIAAAAAAEHPTSRNGH